MQWEGMKWTRNLGFDEMEDIKRTQTHDKNVKNVWIEGISDYIDQVLHFINEETEAPTKYLAFTTFPLNSLLILSSRLSSTVCHWNLVWDIIDNYNLPNSMSDSHSSSYLLSWEHITELPTVALLTYLLTQFMRHYTGSFTSSLMIICLCMLLFFMLESLDSVLVVFSIYSHSPQNLF